MDYYGKNIDRRMSGEKKSLRLEFALKCRSISKRINDMEHWIDDNKRIVDTDIINEMNTLIVFREKLENAALKIERPTAEELSRNIL
jgi:hypothetical protein